MNHKTAQLHREMVNEWESWEHLIREDIERLEHRIQYIYSQMATHKIPARIREPYVIANVKQIIKEVCVGE